MSTMIVFRPLPIASITEGGGSLAGSSANLLTPDPKEAMLHPSGASAAILQVDLGSVQAIDSFLLGYHSYPAGSNLTIQGGSAAYTTATHFAGSALAPSSVPSPMRQHFFYKLPAPVANRYLQFTLTKAGGDATLGILAIGAAFQPTWNREWGSGRRIIDTGTKDRLLGGGFGIGEGAVKRGYEWVFGDLDEAEVDVLEELCLRVGETKAMAVIEDPDQTAGLNQRIHYGLFDKFEPWSRQDTAKTRWALSMEEWV